MLTYSGEKNHRFVNNLNVDFSPNNNNNGGGGVSGQSFAVDNTGVQSELVDSGSSSGQTANKTVTVALAGPGIIVSFLKTPVSDENRAGGPEVVR